MSSLFSWSWASNQECLASAWVVWMTWDVIQPIDPTRVWWHHHGCDDGFGGSSRQLCQHLASMKWWSICRHHWGLPMVPTLCKSPLSRTLLHSRPIGNHHAYGSILVASFLSQGRDNAVVWLNSTAWSSGPPTLGHFNAQILGHLRVRFGQNSQVNDPVSVEIILVSSFIWETRPGF